MSASPDLAGPEFADIDPDRVPKHVAIIMDGNGRWAVSRGLPRIEGHRRGAGVVRMVSETAAKLGIDAVTLYCLSSENWKRPRAELDFLMDLLREYLIDQRDTLLDNRLRLQVIGRRDRLPDAVLKEMDRTIELSAAGTATTLVLAIDYGSRDEIVRATRQLAADVAAGHRSIDSVAESTFGELLDTAGLPDVDLLIRTGGDHRISNFLLWQISYAELYLTQTCWPEFGRSDFLSAIAEFGRRERRFGGLT